jgi:hypothetical protein
MSRAGDFAGIAATVVYLIGDVATFAYLMIQDWPDVRGIGTGILITAINVFLAQIWPIYWAALHWIT